MKCLIGPALSDSQNAHFGVVDGGTQLVTVQTANNHGGHGTLIDIVQLTKLALDTHLNHQ